MMAADVIENLTGVNWGQDLQDHIFGPLGLNHTTTIQNPPSMCVAKGYIAPHICDETLFSGIAGV